jgi:hypothetical protein
MASGESSALRSWLHSLVDEALAADEVHIETPSEIVEDEAESERTGYIVRHIGRGRTLIVKWEARPCVITSRGSL